MEKRTLLFYVGIAVLGIGLMVGVVLYLRSRNLESPTGSINVLTPQTAGTQNNGTQKRGSVRPFVPLNQRKEAAPNNPSTPIPVGTPVHFSSPGVTPASAPSASSSS